MNAKLRPSRVAAVVSRTTRELVILETQTGTLTASREHPFAKIGSGWTRANQLAAGDLLETSSGAPTQLLGVEHVSVPETPVFNLVVEGTHTYFAGESNVLVHNVDCDRDTPLTPEERRELQPYLDGTKLWPPPGSAARRRLDDMKYRAQREDEKNALRPALRDRAKRYQKKKVRWDPSTYPKPSPEAQAGPSLGRPSTSKPGTPPPGKHRVNWTRWDPGALSGRPPAPSPGGPSASKPKPSPSNRNNPPAPQDPPPLTMDDWLEAEAYLRGVTPRPPPGTAERRRTDELERRVAEAKKNFIRR